MKKFCWRNVVVAFILGCSYYLLFRNDYIILRLESLLTFTKYIRRVLYIGTIGKTTIGKIVNSFFPDCMWAWALTFCTIDTFKSKLLAFSIIGITIAVNECIQLFDFMHATFDLYDILLEVITVVIATSVYYIYKFKTERRNKA